MTGLEERAARGDEPWVLVVNAGSSSLKYQVLSPGSGRVHLRGGIDRLDGAGGADHAHALRQMHADLTRHGVTTRSLAVIGHRVVHGGPRLRRPAVIDEGVADEILRVGELAPLHNPPAVTGIRTTSGMFVGVPQVAVFDTAFFADLPHAAATYALPPSLLGDDLRRYGAHGISHEYVAHEAARAVGEPVEHVRQVVLHLGNGASASAVDGGRPVDTSMGLTPLEGLVMGTRAGDLDPGLLIHLLRRGTASLAELEEVLHHRAGLQAMAGMHDVRDLLSALDRGHGPARGAYSVYVHRLRKYVGAYLAVLEGADVITFTGGVGENSARVREDCLRGLGPLGVRLDIERNLEVSGATRRISEDGSPVTVLVVPTNEELSIARQALAVVR